MFSSIFSFPSWIFAFVVSISSFPSCGFKFVVSGIPPSKKSPILSNSFLKEFSKSSGIRLSHCVKKLVSRVFTISVCSQRRFSVEVKLVALSRLILS